MVGVKGSGTAASLATGLLAGHPGGGRGPVAPAAASGQVGAGDRLKPAAGLGGLAGLAGGGGQDLASRHGQDWPVMRSCLQLVRQELLESLSAGSKKSNRWLLPHLPQVPGARRAGRGRSLEKQGLRAAAGTVRPAEVLTTELGQPHADPQGAAHCSRAPCHPSLGYQPQGLRAAQLLGERILAPLGPGGDGVRPGAGGLQLPARSEGRAVRFATKHTEMFYIMCHDVRLAFLIKKKLFSIWDIVKIYL